MHRVTYLKFIAVAVGLQLALACAACNGPKDSHTNATSNANSGSSAAGNGASGTARGSPVPGATGGEAELDTMRGAQAVMVTVELDLGQRVPKVADAMREIERR